MKLSDFVAHWLAAQGIRHVFIVTGGASIHLLHSLHDCPGIEPVCVHHEQAGAMSADAYARVAGLGCAMATSGPGATNLITGIAGAWFDSVPVLYITGQVASFRLKGKTSVRQFGFQETDVVSMVRGITKRAVQLVDPDMIRFELDRAVHEAKLGRPGPVLLDIPDDFQRAVVDTDELLSFKPPLWQTMPDEVPRKSVKDVLVLLQESQRPVMVLGAGVKGCAADARRLAESWQIPVLTTWGAKDVLPGDHPLNAGTFGQDGTRAGNFAMQNADCVLAIGARLSTRETGSLPLWAREAMTIVVDIDKFELRKFTAFGKRIDVPICADAGAMITALLEAEVLGPGSNLQSPEFPDWRLWRGQITSWQIRYPVCPAAARAETTVNPYMLMEELSKAAPDNAHFFIDTGCTIAWAMQGLKLRAGQRIFHDFNNTAMGWALPAAIGGALAKPDVPIICLVGDGSLMFNVQELATIREHNLPIKIIVLDNGGYSMVSQTEDQWLNGKHVGTSTKSGIWFPEFEHLARSFFISSDETAIGDNIAAALKDLFEYPDSRLLRIEIPHGKRVEPKVAFGRPIEDGEPYLPRAEFLANMKVAPAAVSLDGSSTPPETVS